MPTQGHEEKRVGERASAPKREEERERERERERESPLAPFFHVSLPLGLPCANWAQPGVLFVLPEVFTLVLGPSFVLFSRAFPLLVF